MSAVNNRCISDDESAGVCWFFSHNTTVGGNLANKKEWCDHDIHFQAKSTHKLSFLL